MTEPCDDLVELKIGDATVRGNRASVAALLAQLDATHADFYITAGPAARLPPGYVSPRTLNDAARSGALRATPVPRCGFRFTAEDLAAWEATRCRRRGRATVAPMVDDAREHDRQLLAGAASLRGRR